MYFNTLTNSQHNIFIVKGRVCFFSDLGIVLSQFAKTLFHYIRLSSLLYVPTLYFDSLLNDVQNHGEHFVEWHIMQ